MEEKICSFFGHREIVVTEELKSKLMELVLDLVGNKGFNTFYFGGFGMFDDLAWEVVSQVKKEYPNIKRVYCLSDPRHELPSKRPKWLKDDDYEKFIYLDLKFDYWYKRIYYRNCEMIDNSDFVVFYCNEIKTSGAYKALKYALSIKKEYKNLSI